MLINRIPRSKPYEKAWEATETMLQLTKRTEYGLIALTHLATHEGVQSVRSIGERYPVPRRLLAEVLKDLQRSNLVASQRGAQGGYTLARKAEEITLSEVIAALEGHPSLASCESLGAYTGSSCSVESVCPIKSPIHALRESIWHSFQKIALSDLAHWPNAARPSSN